MILVKKQKTKSAIAALIAVLGTNTVSLAAGKMYSDIPDGADYAKAVWALTDLNIIAGYEDGTFGPDKQITRAEAAKLMVSAINMNKAADELKETTKFKDIDAESQWANGYINVGVEKGYINGINEDEFAPKENVTYEQMVKMLVSAMGYSDYAGFIGGYPAGFIAVAENEGLLAGDEKPGEAVTRAQAARLIFNAITASVLVTGGMDGDTGEMIPKTVKQDGESEGIFYKSILTEAFNSYYVEGHIKATPKTDESLNSDELLFEITKSEKYQNDDLAMVKSEDSSEEAVKNVKLKLENAADTEIDSLSHGAIITVDSDGNKYLTSIWTTSKSAGK